MYKQSLVVMTNGDVYYVTPADGRELLKLLGGRPLHQGFYQTVDAKSGATISIAVHHISSVVAKEAGRHAK